MSTTEDIKRYISNIKRMQNSINELVGKTFLENHKKVLFLNLLDTLARGVYGARGVEGETKKLNGDKFTSFITEFCNWEDANRVSVQQLDLYLTQKYSTDSKFDAISNYVKKKLKEYPSSSPVAFKYDLTLEEISSFSSPLNNEKLKQFTHANLLWKLRNGLSHEFRGKDAPSMFNDLTHPHYVMYWLPDFKTKTWIISYPLPFFNYLVDNAIENIESYFLKSDINPFNNYDFGFLW